METTERIVEAYVRYVKGWATIPNIRCAQQKEIDLLAIDPVNLDRYHIESGVSVSVAYSQLTAKPFSKADLRTRVKMAGQRRTVGYFIEWKFENPSVVAKLAEYGFRQRKYHKVIVSWGWTIEAAAVAAKHGIALWDFRDVLREITGTFRNKRSYYSDDTLRTLQLFARSEGLAGAEMQQAESRLQ